MRRIFDSMLSGLALLLVAGVAAQAQESGNHSHGQLVGPDGSAYTCGSHYMQEFDHAAAVEQTRQNNPEAYAKMVQMAEGKQTFDPTAADELIIWTFNMNDRNNPGQFEQVDAKLVHTGDSILIWVDVRDTNHIRASTIDALAVGLEKQVRESANTRDVNTGIVGNDIAIFGPPPTPIEDLFPGFICSFFLTDISEGQLTGGIIEGFFSPWDQTDNLGSNKTNILYIDSREGLGNQSVAAVNDVIGTMAHEFQHLINSGRYTGVSGDASTHWIYNEGLSEVASLRNGYVERSANPFLSNPNLYSYFTRPNSGTDGGIVLRAYERAMLFCHYVSQRYGDAFLNELTKAGGVGLAPTQTAMEKTGQSSDAETVYADFWAANYIRNSGNFNGDPIYSYRDPVHTTMRRFSYDEVPGSPTNYDVELVGHGAYAVRYRNTGNESTIGMKVTFNPAGRNYGVRAIVTRESNAIEVYPITIGQEHSFEKFKEIAFTVANTTSEGTTPTWTVAGTTLGVEEYSTAPELFSFETIAPNPTTGNGLITFASSGPSTVTADMFDVRGDHVATIAEGYRVEQGNYTLRFEENELDPGVYTIRLSDGNGNVAVKQVVIVR